eukprot:5697467-Pyramimonas_sp.AAC.1
MFGAAPLRSIGRIWRPHPTPNARAVRVDVALTNMCGAPWFPSKRPDATPKPRGRAHPRGDPPFLGVCGLGFPRALPRVAPSLALPRHRALSGAR